MNHAQPQIIETESAPGREVAIQPIPNRDFLPMLSVQDAHRRYQELREFIRANLVEGTDYGVIPGTGEKKTLLKPGAEKLCTFFGFRVSFEVLRAVEDWEKGLFYYWYKCRVWRGELCTAEGDGSCNSREKKYRWRSVYDDKASEDERARAVRAEMRYPRTGRPYRILYLENDDIYSVINTLQKMAQKRALIAATLIAVNASDFFTQDLDEVVETEAEPVAQQPPAAQEAPQAKSGDLPTGKSRIGQGAPPTPPHAPPSPPPQTEPQTGGQPGELQVKFASRPEYALIQRLKDAGFRWDAGGSCWRAPHSEARAALAQEITKKQ